MDIPSVRQAARVLAYCDDLGIARERIRLVLNCLTSKVEIRERDVEATLKMSVALCIPEEGRNLGKALQRGAPLIVDRPRSSMARGLRELATNLNGRR
jgi:Flp pilus assembly CpaE family ATPase